MAKTPNGAALLRANAVLIEENSPQAKHLLEYIKTLPFATVVEEKKQTFEQACAECNAISLETFDQMFAEEIRKAYAG